MTKVFLVRHGEVEHPEIVYGDMAGVYLSESGKRQIEEAALLLASQINSQPLIIASPLERAQETAQIIARHFGNVPILTDARLIEWKMGEWVGKPLTEFYKTSGYYDEPMNAQGLEPLDTMAERVIAAINDAVEKADGRDVIICSHREPMAAAIIKYQNLPWEEIHDLDLPKGGVYELTTDQSGLITSVISSGV